VGAENSYELELKFDPVNDSKLLTRTMSNSYSMYRRHNPDEAAHNLMGALILFGMMILFLGILLVHFEMMVLGSGMVMTSSLCYTFFLEGMRERRVFSPMEYHEEVGAEKD
jgi:hypothetical protein